MWDRKEMRTTPPEANEPPRREPEPRPSTPGQVPFGKSIKIHGDLTGQEDLTIDGEVEGRVYLKDHNLTIGSSGKIQGEIFAKNVMIQGEVRGNVVAYGKLEISPSGFLQGDIVAPKVSIAEGARFKGSVDMDRRVEPNETREKEEAPKPGVTPSPSAQDKKEAIHPAASNLFQTGDRK